MSKTNPEVDNYLDIGCGRCSLVGTPACKVKTWQAELVRLREIVLASGLTEELKWKQPCYTFNGKNIVMVSAFNDYAFISFFKGVLMKDPKGILIASTENMQSARQIRFTNVEQVAELETILKVYIAEAVEVEKSGAKIEPKKTSDFEMPEELQAKFEADPVFKAAFEALTPGRKRGYLLYFAQPKQSKTRTSRIEKFMPKIFEGKGWSDR
ncbi:MAG: hypothetical protein HN855_09670 [Anaerolineae bacterium]|nr:hypothetical protein [Anaerolineae bacterium]MBT7071850.1 hypothetical protein [Anaerolineae bacterium]MBT7325416.1 hypothetical protein [Anaerolineae bacterium]MBT7600199.1 hypothetical protein [Anaerolineae bacterium]